MEFFEAEDLNPYMELIPLFSYIHSSLLVSLPVYLVCIFKVFFLYSSKLICNNNDR